MTGSGVTVLEAVVRHAHCGVRFWDPVTARPADARFLVTVRASWGGVPAERAVRALRTRSGVYALHTAPNPGGAGPAGTYRIEVSDPDGGYQPFSFEAVIPADGPSAGLSVPACGPAGSPPGSPTAGSPHLPLAPVVPVFSAPARIVPAGVAVVRAQLELAAGVPAAWATLEAHLPDGTTALGLAGADGQVCVMFPYPEPPAPAPSPPGPGLVTLSAQTWPIGLRAYYGWGPGSPPEPVVAPTGPPDLCDLLDQLPAKPVADDSTLFTSARLRYGRDLTVATQGRSTLLLIPHPGRLHA
ncbi:hypothetical protein ACWDRB_62110 [Nonomuraea sp. NPDC003707]